MMHYRSSFGFIFVIVGLILGFALGNAQWLVANDLEPQQSDEITGVAATERYFTIVTKMGEVYLFAPRGRDWEPGKDLHHVGNIFARAQ